MTFGNLWWRSLGAVLSSTQPRGGDVQSLLESWQQSGNDRSLAQVDFGAGLGYWLRRKIFDLMAPLQSLVHALRRYTYDLFPAKISFAIVTT